MRRSRFSQIAILLCWGCGLLIMMAFSSCGVSANTNDASTGVASNGTTTTAAVTANSITGTLTAINVATHSVTVSVNANGQQQQYTINGFSDQQIAQLQSHIGKTFAFQTTQTNGAYTVAAGSNPQEMDNEVPVATQSTGTNSTTTTNGIVEPGSINFIGKLQSSNANSMNVILPNGDTLMVAIAATTDRSDFATLPTQGQYVKVKVLANTDGSFAAAKLGQVDYKDIQNQVKLNTVDFKAVTAGVVGGDNVIHFNVGHKSFAATIGAMTEVKDFPNVQGIGNNQAVGVKVQFTGANATVLKVDNAND